MNTGFVRPAVATVLTVYGIETLVELTVEIPVEKLQQYLPFTVLKLESAKINCVLFVATVLTVYGIETLEPERNNYPQCKLQQYLPFTVLKPSQEMCTASLCLIYLLQQYLPFTVLKLLVRGNA